MNEKYLKMAIEIAKANVDKGGGPFGALIVKGDQIISSSGNRVTEMNDPTAHAEILAIRDAAKSAGNWKLEGCDLYTSCEPCPMCLGAIYWAHLDHVYYAADHNDAKEAGFDDSAIYREFSRTVQERSLPMIQALSLEGKTAFTKWIEKEDKEEY